MRKVQPGLWLIDDTVREITEIGTDNDGNPYERGVLHTDGIPHLRARNTAAAALFDNLGDRPLLESGASRREPASVLAITDDGSVFIYQGRLTLWGGSRLVLLKKGSLHKGLDLDDLRLLTWEFGADDTQLRLLEAAWATTVGLVPELAETGFDGIAEFDPRRETSRIGAVFLMNHPGFGPDGEMATPGCLFFATDVQPGPEICNGWLWAPADSPLVSEHGSQYYQHLASFGGRVSGFRPGGLGFADLLNGAAPPDRRGAYAWLRGYCDE